MNKCIDTKQIYKYKYINNVPAMKSGLGRKLFCIQLLLVAIIVVSYCLLQHIKCWLLPYHKMFKKSCNKKLNLSPIFR